MLVDVVCLRLSGEKLTSEHVKVKRPVRGRLIIKTRPWADQPHLPKTRTTFAYLIEPSDDNRITPALVPFLRAAHVTNLDGHAFVVVGLEIVGAAFGTPALPQAWWCRLVG